MLFAKWGNHVYIIQEMPVERSSQKTPLPWRIWKLQLSYAKHREISSVLLHQNMKTQITVHSGFLYLPLGFIPAFGVTLRVLWVLSSILFSHFLNASFKYNVNVVQTENTLLSKCHWFLAITLLFSKKWRKQSKDKNKTKRQLQLQSMDVDISTPKPIFRLLVYAFFINSRHL